MKSEFLIKLKRDGATFYFMLHYLKHYMKRNYASCFNEAARIEHFESHISGFFSLLLFNFLKKKYTPADCSPSDPFRKAITDRFTTDSGRLFLRANMLCIKPWISEKEKGVFLVKYTEIMNALPFLFDIKKIQERYHLVIEPSWESPYQMYSAFLPLGSKIFAQSLSLREQKIHKDHGFVPLQVCAGDWVNIKNFSPDYTAEKKYDFCIIANFIPLKRYPFMLSAIKKYWTGDLKFAIMASKYVGNDKNYIHNLLKENGLQDKVDINVEIPPTDVNKILNQSYCHVLGSVREGANKANFESMTAGTPVVVNKYHIGFPNWRYKYPMVINYTDGKTMVDAIKECRKIDKREVAEKAKEMIGSKIATRLINDEIKRTTTAEGDAWTTDILEKVNNVHAFYYDPDDVHKCINDYHFLETVVLDKANYNAELAIERFGKK